MNLFNINVCRVCMQNADKFNSLQNTDLQQKFTFTTKLTISDADNLPKEICIDCTARLSVANKFIETAQESEINLKNFLKKINNEFIEVTKTKKDNKSTKDIQTNDEHKLIESEIIKIVEDNTKLSAGDDVGQRQTNKNSSLVKSTDGKEKPTVKRISQTPEGIFCSTATNITTPLADTNAGIDNDDDIKFQTDIYLMEVDESEQLKNNESEALLHRMQNEAQTIQLIEDSQLSTEYTLLIDTEEDNNSQNDEDNTSEETIKSEEIQNMSYPEPYNPILNQQVYEIQYNPDCLDDNNSTISNNAEEQSVENSTKKTENSQRNDTLYNFITSKKGIDEAEVDGFNLNLLEEKQTRSNVQIAENRIYCNQCNRDFSTKTNLTRHMLSHAGNNKPHQCNVCGKSFTQKSTLKQHSLIHTGEKPYVCSVCNRGFTQCKSLIFHMRRHTGQKPFYCQYCLVTFRQKDALRVHILKHHVLVEQMPNGKEIYTCIICEKKFESNSEFKIHMKIHTSTNEDLEHYEVELEEDQPTSKAASPSSAAVTSTVFCVDDSSAALPFRAKNLQCRKCFKCFSLKKSLERHMRIHGDFHDQQCYICNIQFTNGDDYQKHMSENHVDST